MSTHFWLHSPGAPVSARWTEAFPSGEPIALQQLPSRQGADADAPCLLWLPATDNHWIDHLQQVLGSMPSARVVVLSATPNDEDALRAVAAGARGYAHSHAVPALLRELALVVEHGGYWLGSGPMRLLVERGARATAAPTQEENGSASWSRLSAREADVAQAVHEGRSNKEIARLLGISERTVKAHLGAAFEKLGVRDRLQLALRLSSPAVPGGGAEAPPATALPLATWSHELPRRQVPSAPVPSSNRNATRAGLT